MSQGSQAGSGNSKTDSIQFDCIERCYVGRGERCVLAMETILEGGFRELPK